MNPGLFKIALARRAAREARNLRRGFIDATQSAPAKIRRGFEDGIDISSDAWGRGASVFDPQAASETIRTSKGAADATGNIAGRVVGDVAGNGSRSVIWAKRHPQKVIGDMARDSVASIGGDSRSRMLASAAMAATLGATSGNFDINSFLDSPAEMGRTPGFKAIFPSEDDPRKTSAPVREVAFRYLLGYKGRPLPFKEFMEETGMSADETKAYLRHEYRDKGIDGVGLLKFTKDGLYGEPEARLAGYRIPLSSAVATAATGAGILGYGANKEAIDRFADESIGSGLRKVKSRIGTAIQPVMDAGASKFDAVGARIAPVVWPVRDAIRANSSLLRATGKMAGIAGIAAGGIYGGSKLANYIRDRRAEREA